jgi:hypothetical protein
MVTIRVSDNNAVKLNVIFLHYAILLQTLFNVGEVLSMSTVNENVVLLACIKMDFVSELYYIHSNYSNILIAQTASFISFLRPYMQYIVYTAKQSGQELKKFSFNTAIRGFQVYRKGWLPHLGQPLRAERNTEMLKFIL